MDIYKNRNIRGCTHLGAHFALILASAASAAGMSAGHRGDTAGSAHFAGINGLWHHQQSGSGGGGHRLVMMMGSGGGMVRGGAQTGVASAGASASSCSAAAATAVRRTDTQATCNTKNIL